MCDCVSVCVFVCVRATGCIYVCIYVFVYIYIYIYIYICEFDVNVIKEGLLYLMFIGPCIIFIVA